MRKITGLVMIIVTILLTISPAVQAFEPIDNISIGEMPISLDRVVYSTSGNKISPSLRQQFGSYDVQITECSRIDVVASTAGKAAIVVTSEENDCVSMAVLAGMDDKGDAITMPIPSAEHEINVVTDSWIYDFFDNSSFVVSAGVQYNAFYNELLTYCQPVSAMVKYTRSSSTSVSYLGFEYICMGYEKTYPGYQDVGNSWEPYNHVIGIYRNNPNANTYYSNTSNPYRTDRVIACYESNWAAHLIEIAYTVTINGTERSNTIMLKVDETPLN